MVLWAEYVAVKVFFLELLVCRILMWEQFPQHLYVVNSLLHIQRTLK